MTISDQVQSENTVFRNVDPFVSKKTVPDRGQAAPLFLCIWSCKIRIHCKSNGVRSGHLTADRLAERLPPARYIFCICEIHFDACYSVLIIVIDTAGWEGEWSTCINGTGSGGRGDRLPNRGCVIQSRSGAGRENFIKVQVFRQLTESQVRQADC